MTAPVPFPNESSQLSQFLGPRRTPTEAEVKQSYLNHLTETDFNPRIVDKSDLSEAVRLLCQLSGLQLETCRKPTLKGLRSAARQLLEAVTLAEAQHVIETLDVKSLAWYKQNGSPHSAASKIIDEVSRAAAQQVQARDVSRYLAEPVAKDDGERYVKGWLE